MTPGQLSDETLIAQVARGGSTALETLYDRYATTVLGISLKIIGDRSTAEDIVQETFWRVWKSAITFQPERGSVTDWLFRIARNLAIDAYRRGGVRPQAITQAEKADSILDQMLDPNVDVQAQAYSNLQSQLVRNALKNLPHEQRRVIELAYFYGMPRQEIAELTGDAPGTIHTRARLGLQKLREALEIIKEN